MNLNYYEQNAQAYYDRTSLRPHSAWPEWMQAIPIPLSDASIVDLGSGAGATLKYLQECGSRKSFGVDYSSQLNQILKQYSPELQILTKDIRFWHPAVQSLDGAFMARVIDELNPSEIQRILGALFKGLKSKSPLWIDFLNTDIADTITTPDQRQKNRYPKSEVASLLYQSGFRVQIEGENLNEERFGFLAIRL